MTEEKAPGLPPENITEHFTWKEAACPCGCVMPDEVKARVLFHARELEYLREVLDAPVSITSWYRCPKHNAEVGGEPHGRHPVGDGTDIKSGGKSGEYLLGACETLMSGGFIALGGLGTYEEHPHMLHFDSRGVRARWHRPKEAKK